MVADDAIALVDFWGVRRQVRLDVVDELVFPGDYILNHAGFAIRRIPPEEIELTLTLYEAVLNSIDSGDLAGADMSGELDTASCASNS